MTSEPITPEPKTTLRDALQAIEPAAAPSDALKQRIATLAADAAARVPRNAARRRQTRLRLLGAGATALLILVLLLMPRLNAVIALARMADSLRDVASVHSTEWQILPNGKRVKSRETWYQAGNWRRENAQGHYLTICAGGKRWDYSASENTVTLETATAPLGLQGFTGFSVTASKRDAVAMGVLMDVHVLDAGTLNGRAIHWILVSDNKYPDARSRIAVDDATGLPLQGNEEGKIGGRWVLQSVGISEYNLPIAQSVFTPSFPKMARLIDVEAGREVWRKRLATRIATQSVGGTGMVFSYRRVNGNIEPRLLPKNGPRQVVVRDFQTNARGDVFLLATNDNYVGGGDSLNDATLTDEYGTEYIAWTVRNQGVPTASGPQPFTPTSLDSDLKNPPTYNINGFVYNTEALEGRWWVPLQMPGTNKPHHFTLTIPGENYGANKAVFHLTINKPGCAVLPEYMPYMARPLENEWEVLYNEAIARAGYYFDISHDLPQALAWHQKAIAIDQEQDSRDGLHITEDSDWLAIYQIQKQLGKPEEARTALRNANRESVYAGQTRDKIRAAMDEEGLTP